VAPRTLNSLALARCDRGDTFADGPRIHLSPKSKNRKTGPIPVSTSGKATCPDYCPFLGRGCYAAVGKLAIHWALVSRGERGLSWLAFLERIRALPAGQLWRHNQAGDLAGFAHDWIDRGKLEELTRANHDRRGFTYTHYPVVRAPATADTASTVALKLRWNRAALRDANNGGFAVNVSTECFEDADRARSFGLPTVVVVPETHPEFSKTPAGRPVVVCPEQTHGVPCIDCGACANPKRDAIIAFRVHGIDARKASSVLDSRAALFAREGVQ
jgi:hypothetical protein